MTGENAFLKQRIVVKKIIKFLPKVKNPQKQNKLKQETDNFKASPSSNKAPQKPSGNFESRNFKTGI